VAGGPWLEPPTQAALPPRGQITGSPSRRVPAGCREGRGSFHGRSIRTGLSHAWTSAYSRDPRRRRALSHLDAEPLNLRFLHPFLVVSSNCQAGVPWAGPTPLHRKNSGMWAWSNCLHPHRHILSVGRRPAAVASGAMNTSRRPASTATINPMPTVGLSRCRLSRETQHPRRDQNPHLVRRATWIQGCRTPCGVPPIPLSGPKEPAKNYESRICIHRRDRALSKHFRRQAQSFRRRSTWLVRTDQGSLRKFRLLFPTPYILHEGGALRARRDGRAGGSKNADRTLPLVSETKPRKRECDDT
jgi:hypothetical protein